MKHVVSHPLSRADAKRAVEAAWAEYSRRFARFDPQLRWLAPDHARLGFSAVGRSFDAQVRVLEHGLEVDMDVPLLLRPLVGRATAAIDREVARWVGVIQSQPPSA